MEETLANLRASLGKLLALLENILPEIKNAISTIDSALAASSFVSAAEYKITEKTPPASLFQSPAEEFPETEPEKLSEGEEETAAEMPVYSKKLGITIAKILSNGTLNIKFMGAGLPYHDRVTRFLLKKLQEFERLLGGKMVVVPENGMVVEIKFEGCRKATGTELREIARRVTWAVEKIASRS